MTSLLGILLFVIALMLAIFLHEGGHFTTAKLFGMKVERFFLGFGPTIWSFRRGETEYGVKLLPFGGFCKIAGMSPYEGDGNFLEEDRSAARRAEPVPPERQFRNKPAWQRAIVLAAGSLTHFLVALLLIYVVLVAIGLTDATTTIDSTVATTPAGARAPAQRAGLQPGDRIVAVDGRQVATFDELRAALEHKAGRRITISYVRDGQTRSVSLTAADDNGRGFLGFRPTEEARRLGPVAAVSASGRLFGETTVASVKGLGGFVSGLGDRLRSQPSQPASGGQGGGGDEGGPIGIVGITRLAGQAVANSQWAIFLAILIQLNIIVGVFNLLPLPPMDGGYLAFVGWQALTRREVDLRKVVPVAALIVGLLVVLTVGLAWLDVTNPVPYPFSP
jgi:membrane-associated protease RseP (regulator of RpoE activity)